MNTITHLSPEQLALFALQTLEGKELDAAIRHLERCENCRQEVARFQGDLVGYALALSDLHTPPAAGRERLLRRVAKEKKVVPPTPPAIAPVPQERAPVALLPNYEASSTAVPIAARSNALMERTVSSESGDLFLPSRGRRLFGVELEEPEEKPRKSGHAVASLLGWTGWAVAAGMAVFAGTQLRERQLAQSDLDGDKLKIQGTQSSLAVVQSALDTLTSEGAMQVPLHVPVNGQPEPDKPEGHVGYIPEKGQLVFMADHLPAIEPTQTYQLWLLPADNSDPIPAGLFRPDSRGVATLVMPEIPQGISAKGFGVTTEVAGGSKLPTPPIVLAGK